MQSCAFSTCQRDESRLRFHGFPRGAADPLQTDRLLVVRDLATTNGTKVKGQKVRWAALLPDDRISLGGYKLRVYLGPDDMPSPSEQYASGGRYAGQVSRGVPAGARMTGATTTGPIVSWPEPAPATPLHQPMAPSFP